jgi:hypothetical protein
VDPTALKMRQGEKAKIKIMVDRKNYEGPIDVELSHLPANVTAQKAIFVKGEKALEIEVHAGAKARSLTKSDVQAVGTATEASNQMVVSASFTISIGGEDPFDLQAEPTTVKLAQGGCGAA